MKSILTAGVLACSLLVSACVTTSNVAPSVTTQGTLALDKKGTVELSGTGFAPNAEVTLLFTTKDGVESDIGYAVDPAPVADENGNWKTTWSYGRFVKKKLVDAGDYQLVATDADFTPLSQSTITFK